ncbi:MAG: DUF4126 family protein [Anaerolineae bacterium]|nr:DUF4126 family protein [Anaerolineae bacterium]
MNQQTLLRIVAIGAVAGMRTMTAPALVAAYLRQQSARTTEGSPFQWLGTKEVGTVLALLAAGELAADKIPDIPARIAAGPLLGRAASGALSGAALSEAEGEPAATGAALGAAAAVFSAFAMYHLRRAAGEIVGLPDPLLAVLEDALALRGGSGVLGIASPLQPRGFL